MKLIAKLDGIAGPALSKSMTWTTISGQSSQSEIVWLKGNHQAALIDLQTMEEKDRAPLFGTVNTYAENIPLLAAYNQGNWCGYYYMNDQYYLSSIVKNQEKQCSTVNKVIPEAQSVHSMQFDSTGKFLILVIGSSREISQSSFVLVSLEFGGSFRLVDYFRILETPPNFCPSISASSDLSQWILNTGKSVAHFKVEKGTFTFKDTISNLSAGMLS